MEIICNKRNKTDIITEIKKRGAGLSRKYEPSISVTGREVSLRKYIILPFAALFLSTVVFLCWFSYISAQKTIREFQQTIATEINGSVSSQLRRFFSITSAVVQVNTDFIKVKRLDVSDNDEMQRHFLSQINNLKHLSFIGFSSADGSITSASRDLSGQNIKLMSSQASDGWRLIISDVTQDYGILAGVDSGIHFNASERPWYKFAVEKGSAGWYPVYRYLPYEGYGIGVSSPVYSQDSGKFLGVLTADMSLGRISEYLKSLKIGRHGFVFITDSEGVLVGTTLHDAVFASVDGSPIRYSMNNYPDKRLKMLSESAELNGGAVDNKFFRIGDEMYLINKREFTDGYGLKLNIWTVLSQSDYSEKFQDNLRIAIMVVLTAAVIGWFIIIKIADYLAKPIHELNRHVREVAEGNLKSTVTMESNVVEIKQLSTSFNTMAEKLSESFATLEKRIEERTEELNLANGRLLELTITDELTKVSNRRHFNDVMAREWSHSSRSRTPLTLLMLDIDFFKNYNDHYGHQAGDECLRRVALVLKENVKRVTDLAARYGGEEFAVIMPNTDAGHAPKIAESIRKAVEDCRLEHEKSPFAVVTVSVGYATVVADEKSTADDLIHRADTALYAAKTSGRNRIFG